MGTLFLLSFGIIVHIIFLFSVFDIYFKSPVISGIVPIVNNIPPVGKRVVIISVDGLRADSLFGTQDSHSEEVMPYVKKIMKERGTVGISKGHVPTESRPGHIAILAGFYEDPSAITKGWKENPVTFDSIFNQSYCSFAFGSPDILGIFFKGLNRHCAFNYSYDLKQNFAGNTMEYDNWVFTELSSFLHTDKKNVLFDSGVLFFLHLLGQDTSGHTHKPHTRKYIENLKNVDRLVREIEDLINEFYQDRLTSFILTSDHGMTDWGSHGMGHPNETDTPIVAWGAGIMPSLGYEKSYNINQADITPLLAILLGSPIPVNSIGILPLDYLNMNEKHKAEAMLLNTKQITAQFEKNLEKLETQLISFFHTPFEKLNNEELQLIITSISNQIKNNKYSDAIEKSKVLIQIGLDGLEYYHNYYQRLLLLSISASYVLWIIYLITKLFKSSKTFHNKSKSFSLFFFLFCIIATSLLIVIQKLPFSYCFYFLLPQLLFYLLIKRLKKINYIINRKNIKGLISSSSVIALGLEVIVLSFFHRWFLCLSIIVILLLLSSTMRFQKKNKTTHILWIVSGVALAGFCLLPIIGGQPNIFLIVTSCFALFICLMIMFAINIHTENIFLFSLRCLLVATAGWNSAVIHGNFKEEGNLSAWNQFFSWSLSVFSIALLMIGKPFILGRFDQVFIGLLVPFLLLSVSYEGLFILVLFLHLRCWIYVEYDCFRIRIGKISQETVSFSDFRRAYFFLLYIWVGFFGLGNIASLNSFDPAWVRCFVTVFSPFLMSSLFFFKVIIPFLIITCAMRSLTVILKLKPKRLFVIVLIYCNLMGLNFLYFIKTKGSWLDIGSSLSHYVIQQITVVFLVVLYGISKFLLSFSLFIPIQMNKASRTRKSDIKSLGSHETLLLPLPSYYSKCKLHGL